MARIMIVDDAAFMRMSIRTMLVEAGHEVVAEAANGKEAISLYNQHKPDLVTMDITMPVMNGIESVQEIYKLDPKVKIIMCSAMGQQSMVLDAIQAGAKDFVVKPFQKERVLAAIHTHLG
jgi:two-component system chemotaxis response regulator CheY